MFRKTTKSKQTNNSNKTPSNSDLRLARIKHSSDWKQIKPVHKMWKQIPQPKTNSLLSWHLMLQWIDSLLIWIDWQFIDMDWLTVYWYGLQADSCNVMTKVHSPQNRWISCFCDALCNFLIKIHKQKISQAKIDRLLLWCHDKSSQPPK